MDSHEAETFLYREAQLLDERRFDEWLDLFTDDTRYWMPAGLYEHWTEGASIINDDHTTLVDRVWRLGRPAAHAQMPHSRTSRLISNVLVEESSDDEALVISNFVLYEARIRQTRSYGGQYRHQLRREGGGWKIALKKILIVNFDEPLPNITFLW